MAAPECRVTPATPPPSPPTITTPSIPIATPANVVDVVNALREQINTLFNRISQLPGGSLIANPPQKNSVFKITNQTVTPVKIYDPNDPSKQTYVTVNQVTKLSMQNQNTKEIWEWSQPSSVPGSGS